MQRVTKETNMALVNKYLGQGVGLKASNQAYEETAEEYEQCMELADYKGFQTAAEAVKSLNLDKTIRVLDAGAGTGLLGLELQKLGFTNIDALDASENMLAIAKKRGIYKNYISAFLSDEPLAIPADSYDLIAGAGCLGQNHMAPSAFIEMARLVKPGGRVVIATRPYHLKHCKTFVDNFDGVVQKLKDERKMELERKLSHPKYFLGEEGLTFIFKVL